MAQLDLFKNARQSWNRGRIVGAKPPLGPKHVGAIRQQLKTAGRVLDLTPSNGAIDAKLHGCDLVKQRVSDVATGGPLRARATVIQKKIGRPVPFEITEPTRESLAACLRLRGHRPDEWRFPSRSHGDAHITTLCVRFLSLARRWVTSRMGDIIPAEPMASHIDFDAASRRASSPRLARVSASRVLAAYSFGGLVMRSLPKGPEWALRAPPGVVVVSGGKCRLP